MRTFLMMYSRDCEGDDDRHKSGKSMSTERRSFTMLCSVCSCWWKTLSGWPESPTGHWVRHQLRRLIQRKYTILTQTSFITHLCRVSLVWHLLQNQLYLFSSICVTVVNTQTHRHKSICVVLQCLLFVSQWLTHRHKSLCVVLQCLLFVSQWLTHRHTDTSLYVSYCSVYYLCHPG